MEVRMKLARNDEKLVGNSIKAYLGTPSAQCKISCGVECTKIMFCSAVNIKIEGPCECELFSYDIFRSGLDGLTQPAPGWALYVGRHLL